MHEPDVLFTTAQTRSGSAARRSSAVPDCTPPQLDIGDSHVVADASPGSEPCRVEKTMKMLRWNVVAVTALLCLASAGTALAGQGVVDKTKEGAEKTKDAVVKGTKVVAGKTKDGVSKTGEVMTDGWITTRVHARFVDEDMLKGSDISVDTSKHVVTLTGTVISSAGRARATSVARQTEGVRRVVNRLTLGPKRGN
jgi:hyperosmotically inducible protein